MYDVTLRWKKKKIYIYIQNSVSGCPASPHGKCHRVTHMLFGKTQAQTGRIADPIICRTLLATSEKPSLSHLTEWHIWSTDELCCKNKKLDVNRNHTWNKILKRSAVVCGLTFARRRPTVQLSWCAPPPPSFFQQWEEKAQVVTIWSQ